MQVDYQPAASPAANCGHRVGALFRAIMRPERRYLRLANPDIVSMSIATLPHSAPCRTLSHAGSTRRPAGG